MNVILIIGPYFPQEIYQHSIEKKKISEQDKIDDDQIVWYTLLDYIV